MGVLQVVIIVVMANYVAVARSEEQSLLSEGDIRLENLTDTSVVLIWGRHNNVNSTKNTNPLRLMIQLEPWGNPPFYITPDNGDRHCSIAISQCRLNSLLRDTNYRVIVTMDDVKRSVLLGYATIRFSTYPKEDQGRLKRKIVLYIVVPALCGLIIIGVTLLLVCAKCCRCLCWQEKIQLSRACSHQGINVQNQQRSINAAAETEIYDEAYVSSVPQGPGDESYLSIVSGSDKSYPPHQYDVPGNHRKESSASRQTQFQRESSLAEIVAKRHQQQQQQQQQFHRQPARPMTSPSDELLTDDDGYLEVADLGWYKYNTNGSITSQRQVFNML